MVDRIRLTGQRLSVQQLRLGQQMSGGDPFHLINCDLSNLDLRDVELSHSVFDACDFSGAKLRSCQHSEFHSCNLRRAQLTGADFRWVKASNCRVDGADMVGIQTTLDCNFWSGCVSDLKQDAYLLLHWMAPVNPLLQELADRNIPDRVKALLSQVFIREL